MVISLLHFSHISEWARYKGLPTSSTSALHGFPLASSCEIRDGAVEVEKKRGRKGRSRWPTSTSLITAPSIAALSASTSSISASAPSNNSSTALTGRHDLSHRQLTVLYEMPWLASVFRNIGGSRRPVGAFVDERILSPEGDSKVYTQGSGTDVGAADSGRTTRIRLGVRA